ncbi:MAG: hypothetical protein ACJ8DM_11385 [Microvirga sp.]
MQKITPHLWYVDNAEEAAHFNDRAKAKRVMEAMLAMVKLDIAALRRAYEAGEP